MLVLFAKGDLSHAEDLARDWAEAVPRSAFAGLETDLESCRITLAPLRERILDEAAKLGLGPLQIIIVGSGKAGQRALDLVLLGIVRGVGAIIVDIPPGPIPISPGGVMGSVRFVQHRQPDDPDGGHFDALVQALRLSSLDIRIIALPEGPDPASRALGTFLVELVANASRHRSPVTR